jgi:hypothetical protein
MRKILLASAALVLSATGALAAGTWLGADIQDTGAVNEEIANASSTGTTLNTLSKYVNGQAVILATSDLNLARGVCMSGCGTTGTAVIAYSGNAQLLIDAAHTPTAGHFVTISSTNAGYGSDTGAATCPTGASQVVGIVQSNVSGSIYNVKLGTFGCTASLSAGQSSITEYISHGTSTYTAPTNATIFHVIVCGAAGGGSSGVPQASGTSANGGSGGGTGSCVESYLTAAQMGATATVVAGQGGAGGGTSTTLNVGNNGSDGTNTTLTPSGSGPVLTGYHGGGGGTATTGKGASCAGAATGTTAPTTTCVGAAANAFGYPNFAGTNGFGGSTTAGTGATTVSVNFAGASASSGGGISTSTASAGGAGVATLAENSVPAGGTSGTTTGGTGGNGVSPSTWIPWLGGGSSAGGGGSCNSNPCTGGPAGTGALLAGGSGGGASVGTSGSGAGAAGGDGAVWIEAKF